MASISPYALFISIERYEIFLIGTLFKDLGIVLKKSGYISARIDYSDHYSHTDRNISELNFLKYSEKQWQNYNNTYLYQNRLRHDDYVKLLNNSSFFKEYRDLRTKQVLVEEVDVLALINTLDSYAKDPRYKEKVKDVVNSLMEDYPLLFNP